MSKGAKSFLAIGTAALAVVFLLIYAQGADTGMQSKNTKTLAVGNATIAAEVVATDASRELGLSGRSSLGEGTGMLFVFDKPGSQGIWMKDMRFAIDIVWMESDGSIITIKPNVSPQTYPEAFYPARPTALYVLELPAGFAAAYGLAEGDKIVVQ